LGFTGNHEDYNQKQAELPNKNWPRKYFRSEIGFGQSRNRKTIGKYLRQFILVRADDPWQRIGTYS
jgi:hypothetical protein